MGVRKNLIILYYEPYYEIHGTMSMDFVCELAKELNWHVICFYDERTKDLFDKKYFQKPCLKALSFESLGISNCYDVLYGTALNPPLHEYLQKIIYDYRPDQILFFNEFYFLKYFLNVESTKTYFVRCLSKPLLTKILESDDGGELAKDAVGYEFRRYQAEREVILEADHYIVDSKNSQDALKSYYGIEAILCKGYPQVSSFKDCGGPDFSLKAAYYLGRFDWQKGLQNLSPPCEYELSLIGGNILGKKLPSQLYTAKRYEWLSFAQYKNLIEKIPFALFPHIWESNGLALQEALAMGKIVVVQKGSGGLEESINHGDNGFVFDFKLDNDWEKFLNHLRSEYNLAEVSRNARNTLGDELYEDSIKHLAKALSSAK